MSQRGSVCFRFGCVEKVNNPPFSLLDFQGITTLTAGDIGVSLSLRLSHAGYAKRGAGVKEGRGRRGQRCFLLGCKFIALAFRSSVLGRKWWIDLNLSLGNAQGH